MSNWLKETLSRVLGHVLGGLILIALALIISVMLGVVVPAAP